MRAGFPQQGKPRVMGERATIEFYSSKGRVQRVLEDEHINPFPLQIFKSYLKSMDEYAKKAGGNSAQ